MNIRENVYGDQKASQFFLVRVAGMIVDIHFPSTKAFAVRATC
jgi:hypothetical protein